MTRESGGLGKMRERRHTLGILPFKNTLSLSRLSDSDGCFYAFLTVYSQFRCRSNNVSLVVFLFLAFNIAPSCRLPVGRLFVSMLSRVFVSARGTAVHDRGNEFLSTAATRNSLRINF